MNLLDELKRRNVFRVAIAYVILGWVVIQVTDVAVPALYLPDWVPSFVFFVGLIGFPFALLFAWAFELTPDGLKSSKEVSSEDSIRSQTAQRLEHGVVVLLLIAISFFAWDKFGAEPVADSAPTVEMAAVPPAVIGQSIAVLPFVNMSDDKDYFADGLSEEILNLLAKNRELKVAGRTSSFKFKGLNEDLRIIGKALDVATVLEGSVRKSGMKLRITAQLINVADGYHIWSETYDREMTDIFAVQDDIAAKILAALEIHLGTAKPARKRPTESMLAYEKYLAAKAHSAQDAWNSLTPINLLKEVVEIDPNFAEAWELLALEYWNRGGMEGIPQEEAAVLCLEAASMALALDPSLSIAKAMVISADPEQGAWHAEIEALEKASLEYPNHLTLPLALISDLISLGYFAEALPYAEHRVRNNPLSANAHFSHAHVLWALGRSDEAEAAAQRTLDLGDPAVSFDFFISRLRAGDLDKAIYYYAMNMELNGQDPKGAEAFVRAALDAATGKQFVLDYVMTLEPGWAGARWAYLLAFGHMDELYDELEANIRPELFWDEAGAIIFNVMIHGGSSFITHPRYIPTMEKMGIVASWDVRGAPDHCSKDSGDWVCE
ncbi:MAG: hypothetical protein V7711_06015 [Pseudomonadales bacterium]